MKISIPEGQVEELRKNYKALLQEFVVAQHKKLCPVCPFDDIAGDAVNSEAAGTDVHVDPGVGANSVPWRGFIRGFLVKFVRPALYASAGKSDPLSTRAGAVLDSKDEIQAELDVTIAAIQFFEGEMREGLSLLEADALEKALDEIQSACPSNLLEQHSAWELRWLVGDGAAEAIREEAYDSLIFHLDKGLDPMRRSISHGSTLDTGSLEMRSIILSERSLLPSGPSSRVNSDSQTLGQLRRDG
ncbi:hypothetical protein NCC49_004746 [Naganishia albida]|nr:hypothetical protein NCC49_004746 [Naganishia albida]